MLLKFERTERGVAGFNPAATGRSRRVHLHRGGVQNSPKDGEFWECRVAGTNPRDTVTFVNALHKVESVYKEWLLPCEGEIRRTLLDEGIEWASFGKESKRLFKDRPNSSIGYWDFVVGIKIKIEGARYSSRLSIEPCTILAGSHEVGAWLRKELASRRPGLEKDSRRGILQALVHEEAKSLEKFLASKGLEISRGYFKPQIFVWRTCPDSESGQVSAQITLAKGEDLTRALELVGSFEAEGLYFKINEVGDQYPPQYDEDGIDYHGESILGGFHS